MIEKRSPATACQSCPAGSYTWGSGEIRTTAPTGMRSTDGPVKYDGTLAAWVLSGKAGSRVRTASAHSATVTRRVATIRALWNSQGELVTRDSPYFPLRNALFARGSTAKAAVIDAMESLQTQQTALTTQKGQLIEARSAQPVPGVVRGVEASAGAKPEGGSPASPPAPPESPRAPMPPWHSWFLDEEISDPRPPAAVVQDVRNALAGALESAGPRLRIVGADEMIIVGVDFFAPAAFGVPPRPARTLVLRAQKKDLDERGRAAISAEELRKRITVSEY
jgi:hypothetical protein